MKGYAVFCSVSQVIRMQCCPHPGGREEGRESGVIVPYLCFTYLLVPHVLLLVLLLGSTIFQIAPSPIMHILILQSHRFPTTSIPLLVNEVLC